MQRRHRPEDLVLQVEILRHRLEHEVGAPYGRRDVIGCLNGRRPIY
jgi:hypothetical protein